MCRVAGVILAAGRSSRMKEMKLLLGFHGKPLIVKNNKAFGGALSGLDPKTQLVAF
jgi:CTP:molybdopterin cytidylyltransferase MocA